MWPFKPEDRDDTPVAQASFGDEADTASRVFALSAFGLGTMDQRRPSQCSMSVTPVFVATFSTSPTAHASVRDRTETPNSVSDLLRGLGLGTTLHETPSQCSMRVRAVSPPLSLPLPTAHTSSSAEPATAKSWFDNGAGFGVGTWVHVPACSWSAMVAEQQMSATVKPTAQAPPVEKDATSVSSALPLGSGAGATRHGVQQ